MSNGLALTLETRPEELERLTAAIETLAEQDNWPAALTFKVNLVLEELVLNVINYAYDESGHQLDVKLTCNEEDLVIEITDEGKPFDPLHDAPDPDMDSPMEERRIGGLGVYLVRTMTSDMQYRREDGKNHMTVAMSRDE
ncbi:MAG: ATP-binding protein [Chloroflexota bacterium]|nr:ATP-binding protein [Chloroflexota bacterium]MDE2884681.1 ATP-binding protein [Chloroflexota bacterium]